MVKSGVRRRRGGGFISFFYTGLDVDADSDVYVNRGVPYSPTQRSTSNPTTYRKA